MATKVFNTSSAAHMKGPSHQRSWSIYAHVRACPNLRARIHVLIVPRQRDGEAGELWF